MTRITIMKSMSEPPVLEKAVEGAATTTWTVTATGVPRWSWLDAEPYRGDPTELLAAVAALHAAYGRKDLDAIFATRQALEDDFTVVMGPSSPQEKEQEREFLNRGRLEPLAARFAVTAYQGGRLVAVESDDGAAPIVITVPDSPVHSEVARFWTRKDGRWQVVR